jgi:hypothetical protein
LTGNIDPPAANFLGSVIACSSFETAVLDPSAHPAAPKGSRLVSYDLHLSHQPLELVMRFIVRSISFCISLCSNASSFGLTQQSFLPCCNLHSPSAPQSFHPICKPVIILSTHSSTIFLLLAFLHSFPLHCIAYALICTSRALSRYLSVQTIPLSGHTGVTRTPRELACCRVSVSSLLRRDASCMMMLIDGSAALDWRPRGVNFDRYAGFMRVVA